MSRQQAPDYLWIGCSDSRVPANEICGLLPGEIFVHRNVANIVVHSDLNCLSVMQYAVDVLRVKHIIVVGHYGCGGVRAALENKKFGLIDNWLRHVQDVSMKYTDHLACYPDDSARVDRLCELNVIAQVLHAAETTVVQNAWERGQDLAIHGWVYGLKDGLGARPGHHSVLAARPCRGAESILGKGHRFPDESVGLECQSLMPRALQIGAPAMRIVMR